MNSDDHAYFLKKNNRNPSEYRPDIVHQVSELHNYGLTLCFNNCSRVFYFFEPYMTLRPCCRQALLMILDSQLNKSGMVQAVYVKTEKGVLFEVKPHARLPRTFKHFCGLMCKLFCSHLNIQKHASIVCVCVG